MLISLWIYVESASSTLFPPSSVICPLPSLLRHLSSVVCPLTSVLRPLPSFLSPISYLLFPLYSALCPPSSVICPLTPVVCHLPSVLRRLSSVSSFLYPLSCLPLLLSLRLCDFARDFFTFLCPPGRPPLMSVLCHPSLWSSLRLPVVVSILPKSALGGKR